jgi:hypothetical protein
MVHLSGEFDVRRVGVGLGSGFAFFPEFLEAEGDGAAEIVFDFAARGTGGDAGRKIGGVGGVACAGFFDDDEIFFHGEVRRVF